VKTPIFGPFDVTRSTNFADNRIVNLFGEVSVNKDARAIGALYGTPGLDLLATCGAGPIKALYGWNNALYVVSGTTLYSVAADFTVTSIGSVAAPSASVAGFSYTTAGGLASIVLPFNAAGDGTYSMTDNGQQLGIFIGATATQQDGFVLLNQPGSYLLFQSNLLDLTTWDALNFASASGDPDNIVALKQTRRLIFVLKQNETEVWNNAGASGFAFQRLDGVYIETGIIAAQSLVRSGQSLFWLSQNKQGERIVVELEGLSQVRRVSNHAVEYAISKYSTVSDCVAYSYQQEGHNFIVFNFPTGNETWVYDATTSALMQAPIWHQRAAFSGGLFGRHWGNCYASFQGKHIVGDYRNGNLYNLTLDTLTDNGAQRKWLRSWRATPQPTDEPMRFSFLFVDMQSGIGVPDGTDPQLVLRWSDDGGHNFSNEYLTSAGKTGETTNRAFWTRMGSTRRNSGLDRIFELSSTDQFPVVILGADVG
jgi:hypothetical protein